MGLGALVSSIPPPLCHTRLPLISQPGLRAQGALLSARARAMGRCNIGRPAFGEGASG